MYRNANAIGPLFDRQGEQLDKNDRNFETRLDTDSNYPEATVPYPILPGS